MVSMLMYMYASRYMPIRYISVYLTTYLPTYLSLQYHPPLPNPTCTHPPTHSPTHPPTQKPTHPPLYLSICQFTFDLKCIFYFNRSYHIITPYEQKYILVKVGLTDEKLANITLFSLIVDYFDTLSVQVDYTVTSCHGTIQ